jgi:hypothetical protein
VVYRDVTRQAKGLYRLKHVGALVSGLMYLSRHNSGWFCHTPTPASSALSAPDCRRRSAGHVQRSRCPRAALSPSTRPPLPCRRLPDPALVRPCFFHIAPPPPELPHTPPASPAPARACCVKSNLKAYSAATLSHFYSPEHDSPTALSSSELNPSSDLRRRPWPPSTATPTTFGPRSSASPAYHDPQKLTKQTN